MPERSRTASVRRLVRRVVGGAACLLACALVACGTDDVPADVDDGDTVLDTAPIADLLRPEALGRIAYGDGAAPVTDGSWYRPLPATSWTWQLQGPLNLGYGTDVYVIDMFSTLGRDSMARLRARGRRVLCYFSAGTFEPWRPDAHLFDPADLGAPHAGFPDEPWLNPRSDRVIRIMINRMDVAVRIGCDGIELDNVDAHVQETTWNVTAAEQARYARVLANAAHERNLAVALKNSVSLLPGLVDWFDLAINEECFEFDECERYRPMLAAGKPVFNAEFRQLVFRDEVARERMCVRARALGLRTLVLPLALDGSFRYGCDG